VLTREIGKDDVRGMDVRCIDPLGRDGRMPNLLISSIVGLRIEAIVKFK
jgi:hypothetical protein